MLLWCLTVLISVFVHICSKMVRASALPFFAFAGRRLEGLVQRNTHERIGHVQIVKFWFLKSLQAGEFGFSQTLQNTQLFTNFCVPVCVPRSCFVVRFVRSHKVVGCLLEFVVIDEMEVLEWWFYDSSLCHHETENLVRG